MLSNTCKHSGKWPDAANPSVASRVPMHHSLNGLGTESDKALKVIGLRIRWRCYRNALVTHFHLTIYSWARQRQDRKNEERNGQAHTTVTPITTWMSSPLQPFRVRSPASTANSSFHRGYWTLQNDFWQHSTNNRQTWGLRQPWIRRSTVQSVQTEQKDIKIYAHRHPESIHPPVEPQFAQPTKRV